MKIGLLSDTHDNANHILKATEIFRQEKVETVCHCGDLTNPDMIWYLDGFRLIYCLGNMDFVAGGICQFVKALNSDNEAVPLYCGELGGISIAAVHGHIPGQLDALIASGRYAYVFHGHTHQRRNEKIGGVRVINPGSAGGRSEQGNSICIVDLDTDEVRFISLG